MRKKFTDCVDLAGTSCKNFSGTKRYISTGAIDENHINENDVEIINFSGKPSRANLVVLAGDAIFAKMQATKKTLLIDDELAECIYSTGFYAVHAKKNVIKEKCLFYLLTSDAFLKQKDKNCSGATQKAITNTGLKKIIVNIPDYKHQDAVVEKLDAVSRIISLYQNELKCFDELVKARFVEMFGDPDRNPMNWETAELKRHLEIVGGFAFKSDRFTGSGIPVLRIGNINSGRFLPVNMVFWPEDSSLARYKIYPGDLVMSLTGTVGKNDYGNVCILSDEYPEYYLNQRNAKLAIKVALNKHYLSEILKFSSVKKRLTGISRGVRQANISNGDILTLCVPIPPITLQEQFAAFVTQVDKSKAAVQKSLDEAQLLFNSLMQQYFG